MEEDDPPGSALLEMSEKIFGYYCQNSNSSSAGEAGEPQGANNAKREGEKRLQRCGEPVRLPERKLRVVNGAHWGTCSF
jgi:hypothetical protein